MNFFEHQDKARRNTKWLVMMFSLAVLAIVVAIDLLNEDSPDHMRRFVCRHTVVSGQLLTKCGNRTNAIRSAEDLGL